MSGSESQLVVTDVTVSPLREWPDENRLYTITANQALWRWDAAAGNPVFTLPAIPLERVLKRSRLHLPEKLYEEAVVGDAADITNALHFIRERGEGVDVSRVNPQDITHDLKVGVRPAIRIRDHNRYPGQMYVHRTGGCLGRVVLGVAEDLATIQRVVEVRGQGGIDITLYGAGELLLALAAPDADLDAAKADLRRVLTA